MQRIWVGTFDLGLGYGALGSVVFDAQFVDQMQKQILNRMAADKVIYLADGKAQIPSK